MGDACCGTAAIDADDTAGDESGVEWRTVAAAIAAGSWVTGVVAEIAGVEVLATGAFIVAVVAGGSTFAPGALLGLRRGRLGVSLLMTIAAIGALVLGELAEAAALCFLFSVSEALEDWAVTRARRGLRALLSLVPPTTLVRRGGDLVEIETDELAVGDLIVLRAGARMPTDGIVRTGRSVLDVSAVTGESIPVDAAPGDRVLAGSINTTGTLDVEATAATSDSTLTRIVHAVEEAQDRKGRAQRLADRVARPLIPTILVVAATIAAAGAIFGEPDVWIERALVVLVAASPCAFAIAVPVTVFASIGAASRAGFVIKGGASIEALATVRAIAFDKTGTLTRNEPQVVDTVAATGSTPAEVLTLAASLERFSDHPLAAAIVAAAPTAKDADDVTTDIGSGITGRVGDTKVRVGKPGYIDPAGLTADVEHLQAAGATVVLVERNGATIGAIALRDELRPEAADVVARLRRHHRLHIAMLTGDQHRTATAIGAAAGIDDLRSELLPDDKLTAVEQLRTHGPVAMIGDGINDAPALATADVGIAMGAAGSDVAVEAADIAIMGDRLTHVPDLIGHARRTRRIMIQNLVLSGMIIAVLIPTAAAGLLGLGVVVAIHEGAEIIVIANGLRARSTTNFNQPAPAIQPNLASQEHVHA
jgi:cation-transporting P-type ATPase G